MLVISIIAPVMQLVILGFAANLDVQNIPALICDMDNSPESREFISNFRSSDYFQIKEYCRNTEKIDESLKKGEVTVALSIPSDFSRKIKSGGRPSIQAIVDGSDASTISISMSYISGLIREFSEKILVRKMDLYGGKLDRGPIKTKIRVWFNENLESRNFMVPGIIGVLLMVITLLLTSLAIVREKESRTLEQISVTPIEKNEFILGKLIPFIIIGFIDVLLVVSTGRFIFGVPLRGSIFLILGTSLLFIVSTLGLGLFVSTVSKTQKQAMLTVMFFFMLPMVYLSGFVFPIENMPKVIQGITYLIPLKYFLVAVRGIFLKGAGINVLWKELTILAVLGASIFTMSVFRFRKKLE